MNIAEYITESTPEKLTARVPCDVVRGPFQNYVIHDACMRHLNAEPQGMALDLSWRPDDPMLTVTAWTV